MSNENPKYYLTVEKFIFKLPEEPEATPKVSIRDLPLEIFLEIFSRGILDVIDAKNFSEAFLEEPRISGFVQEGIIRPFLEAEERYQKKVEETGVLFADWDMINRIIKRKYDI